MSCKNLILSAFMVAGTAVGSGVLALPILAAKPGLTNTLIFISFTFVIAYLMAITTINVYARYDNHEINAASLAYNSFGKAGYRFTILLNVFSMGALAAAYVNAGGDLLVKTVLPSLKMSLNPLIGMLSFFLVFMPAFIIGLRFISKLNGLIFTIKFFCLALGIILGLNLIKTNIFVSQLIEFKYIGAGASTMFCIWMMHMVIPLVMRLNNWETKKAKLAVLIGLLIPAFLYIGWMLLLFSLVPREFFLNDVTVGEVIHYALNQPGTPSIIASLVGIFASITILTAFLSVGFSLIAFTLDALKWQDTKTNRFYATILSFGIPVIIALSFPRAFVAIYQQSNIFQIGAALIPVAVAIYYNYRHKITLKIELLVFTVGVIIIFLQILDDMAWLPS